MPCFYPIRGYRSNSPNENGRYPVVFNFKAGLADRPFSIPCGQCIGCRIERSRSWAIRCVHEASLYESNCFITLTYSDEFLSADRNLLVEDTQLFWKRLRKKFGKGIRYFMCGEYGERFGRPHYHACVFNFDFPDKVFKRVNAIGDRIYSSDSLQKIWGMGDCEIGAVSYASAAYVARYVLKKITGPDAEQAYWFVDDDGVCHDRRSEFVTMSRRPGIGRGWLDRYTTDVFPRGYLIHEGKRHRVPRFYDGLFELMIDQGPMKPLGQSRIDKIRSSRIRAASKKADDSSLERRRVREIVQLERMKRLKREIE